VIRRIAVALLLLAAAGCAGSLLESHTEPPKVYRLTAAPAAGEGRALEAALSVARPRAGATLDTDRIAVAHPGDAFDYVAGVRWAEPAPQMLQQVLVEAFAADGGFAATVAAPSRVPAEYMLDVELRKFTVVYPAAGSVPEVRVQWQATVVESRHGGRMASFLVDRVVAVSANRREAVIAAFQQATSEAVAETVTKARAAGAAGTR